MRCTPQRYAVMAFLMEHNGHPTAAEIFPQPVNRVDPRSSRATTYTNLRTLVPASLVRQSAHRGPCRAIRREKQFHHFICDRCGNVEDMEWYDVPRPASGSLGKRMLRECDLIYRGFCTKCAPRRSSLSGLERRVDTG